MASKGRVVVAGGSGFIGRHLVAELEAQGYEALVLSRHSSVPALRWDGRSVGPWAASLEGAAAVINLAGRSINTRLTGSARRDILESRVGATEAIGRAIQGCAAPPKVWINANAMGFYGDRGDEVLTEESAPGTGFFAEVSRAWQRPLELLATPDTAKVTLRIGFVLGADGGGLPVIAGLTRWFLGGHMGSGKQWLAWIHIDDLVRMFLWALNSAHGHYNASAPNPVTNGDFMHTLRRVLNRPWSPPVPAPALRLLGKVMAPDPSLGLISCRMLPQKAMQEGFTFSFPMLGDAVRDLLTADSLEQNGAAR